MGPDITGIMRSGVLLRPRIWLRKREWLLVESSLAILGAGETAPGVIDADVGDEGTSDIDDIDIRFLLLNSS